MFYMHPSFIPKFVIDYKFVVHYNEGNFLYCLCNVTLFKNGGLGITQNFTGALIICRNDCWEGVS